MKIFSNNEFKLRFWINSLFYVLQYYIKSKIELLFEGRETEIIVDRLTLIGMSYTS